MDGLTELLEDLSPEPETPTAESLPDFFEQYADLLDRYFEDATIPDDRKIYKIINTDGSARNGGTFDYSPYFPHEDGTPGPWTPLEPVRMCHTGYHFTHSPDLWAGEDPITLVFEIEARGAQIARVNTWNPDAGFDNKGCAQSIRLVRDVTAEWRDRFKAVLEERERARIAEIKRQEEERKQQRLRDLESVKALRQFFQDHDEHKMLRIVEAIRTNKLIVFGDAPEDVVKTVMKSLPCPHCDEVDWALKHVQTENFTRRTEKEIAYSMSDLETDGTKEEEDNYNDTSDHTYSCCGADLHHSDFDTTIYIVRGGDWEDNVHAVFENIDAEYK